LLRPQSCRSGCEEDLLAVFERERGFKPEGTDIVVERFLSREFLDGPPLRRRGVLTRQQKLRDNIYTPRFPSRNRAAYPALIKEETAARGDRP